MRAHNDDADGVTTSSSDCSDDEDVAAFTVIAFFEDFFFFLPSLSLDECFFAFFGDSTAAGGGCSASDAGEVPDGVLTVGVTETSTATLAETPARGAGTAMGTTEGGAVEPDATGVAIKARARSADDSKGGPAGFGELGTESALLDFVFLIEDELLILTLPAASSLSLSQHTGQSMMTSAN